MSPRRPPPRPSRLSRLRSKRMAPRRRPEDNIRVAAAWVLERVLDSSAPVTPFLGSIADRFDDRDQDLLRELVLGSLRWLRRLDQVITVASHRRFEEIEPALHAPLRIGAYQLLYLHRIPAYAAVDEAVELSRSLTHRGGASFVNAVLRRIGRSRSPEAWPVEERDEIRRWGVLLSHPDFLVERWSRRFGWERTRAMLAANNRAKALQLLAFRDRGGRELLAESLIDEGLTVEPTTVCPLGITVRAGNVFATQAFQRGELYVQDEASQLAALVPPPEPGETIYDAAAAPGGKSFSLMAWEPSVEVVAGDIGLDRLGMLRENRSRLRRRFGCMVADAAQPPLRQRFRRVVLDLPCSGTGTLRKHPELKWRLSASEISRLARQGTRLMDGVAPLVEPGGLLAVITCSLEWEENEAVLHRFLESHPEFDALALQEVLPGEFQYWIEARGRWRIFPEDEHDGFTVHIVRRQG